MISLQRFLVNTVSQSFYWNNLWDHSKVSSGRFVAGVNETQSKICLLKNFGYFRDICHKLFSNNACFAADVVGFMIHILGYVSSQFFWDFSWDVPNKICWK